MAIYLVTRPTDRGALLADGISAVLVEADDVSTAKAMATAAHKWDSAWTDATATDVTTLSAADYQNWSMHVKIDDPAVGTTSTPPVTLFDLTVTGGAAATLDTIAADMVTALRGRSMSAAIAEDGGVFTDETVAADEDTADDMTLFPATPVAGTDRYNLGSTTTFGRVAFDITTVGTGTYTVTWEYWDGSVWTALSGVTDGTTDFKTSGLNEITFTVPSDWAKTTINSQGPFYFIRAETQTGTTTAQPLAGRVWVGAGTLASFSTPTLTAAAVADNIGDHVLTMTLTPPSGSEPVADVMGAIVDEGIAGAVLSGALAIPTAIPANLKLLKQ